MIYAVLDYKITYTDKTTKSGHVPFRGYDTDNNTLIKFVEGYFAGPKPTEIIEVNIQQQYEDPQLWLRDVRFSEEFQYLQRINNFAGDLIDN